MPTILLVEDNELNRDMLSRRLGRRGFAVLSAHDGEDGHTMACAHAPVAAALPLVNEYVATEQYPRAEPLAEMLAKKANKRERGEHGSGEDQSSHELAQTASCAEVAVRRPCPCRGGGV